MFYPALRTFVKFGMKWYVKDWQVRQLEHTQLDLPTIVVANHPNSFFDALVLAVHSPKDTRFLVRGDIFEKPWANWLLRNLFMIPIYKKSDDPDFEVRNAFTYDECAKCLKSSENIVLFPEGVSRNSHQLRPLMPHGFVALTERAIRMDVPVQIQAFALGYNSFDSIPKAVALTALTRIDSTDYLQDGQVDGKQLLQQVRQELEAALPLGPVQPKQEQQAANAWMKVPAQLGYYTHHWLYKIVRQQVEQKTKGTIFFDSLLFGVLLFGYPILIFLLSLILGNLIGFWTGIIFFFFMPFLSYCWVQYQPIKVTEESDELKVNQLN